MKDEIKLHTLKGEFVMEGENLDIKCPCGREEWTDDEITMSGNNYVYVLCTCDRMIRIEWNRKGFSHFFAGEVGSASEYTKLRTGE